MPRIVRFRDLEPTWTTRRAREPGFMRWLVTWVGGPPGFINTNPDVAIGSEQCAIGLMALPAGQRQAGLHVHGVTEIYVVLEGVLEGIDASAERHRAGPMDCTSIPAGCPHGVRNCGLEDVLLVWVHDGIEREDVAVYYSDDHAFGDVPAIDLVRFADLEPDWSAPGARAAGSMRWSVDWIRNGRVAVGLTVVETGQRIPAAALSGTRFVLVIRGEAITDSPAGASVLGRLDGMQVASGEAVWLRNNGPDRLHLLWVDSPA